MSVFKKIKNLFKSKRTKVIEKLDHETELIIKSMKMENGRFDIVWKANYAVHILAESMYELVSKADNYLEIAMTHRTDKVYQPLVITIQKADKKTPHQFRKEAEEEVSRLKKEIEELKGVK